MKKNFLDSIDVQSPCNESWDEMIGNNEVRFCSHCAKNVYNISEMTRQKAEELIKNSNGKLCVRYVKTPEGNLITVPPKLTQITRRATIAASVLATSLALSTLTYAQGEPVPTREKLTQNKKDKVQKPKEDELFATLSGTIQDQAGAVIAGAKITLRNTETQKVHIVNTNADGFYEFKKVELNIYEIEIESFGFEKLVLKKVEVLKEAKLVKSFTLKVGKNVEILGVVATSTEIKIEGEDFKPLDKTVEQKQIVDLPINNRHLITMGLIPAVVPEQKPQKANKPKNKKKKN